MRQSNNLIIGGILKEGFDYDLQVWVFNFIISDCGHPAGNCECNQRKYHGQRIDKVKKELKREVSK